MTGRILMALTAGLALTGCAGGDAATTATEPAPVNYRQAAAAHIRQTFFDPYSIRDAEIAPPKRGAGPSLNADGFKTPWVVCVRANAKNRMGAYAGRKVTALAFSGNAVVNAWDEAQYSQMVCGEVTYEPFPEIEADYKPPAPSPAARPKRP